MADEPLKFVPSRKSKEEGQESENTNQEPYLIASGHVFKNGPAGLTGLTGSQG